MHTSVRGIPGIYSYILNMGPEYWQTLEPLQYVGFLCNMFHASRIYVYMYVYLCSSVYESSVAKVIGTWGLHLPSVETSGPLPL